MPAIKTNSLPPSPCVAEAIESMGKFAELLTQTACEGFPDAIYRAMLAHYAAVARILQWHSASATRGADATPMQRPDADIAYAVPLLLAEIDNTDAIISMLRARNLRAYGVLAWLQGLSNDEPDPSNPLEIPAPVTADATS